MISQPPVADPDRRAALRRRLKRAAAVLNRIRAAAVFQSEDSQQFGASLEDHVYIEARRITVQHWRSRGTEVRLHPREHEERVLISSVVGLQRGSSVSARTP